MRGRRHGITTLLGGALLLGLAACADGARNLAPIRLEPLQTLGETAGDGAMATWPRVSALHPHGWRVLVPQPGGVPALPLVYSDSGAFLGLLGSRGDSVGEFREPLFARFAPHDSLWIFDGAGRALLFDPERRWVRSIATGIAPWDAQLLADGRMLVSSSSSEQPFPLRLLRADGTLEREVAGDSASRALRNPRRIVLAPDGTWWTIPMQFRWRLEHWDSTGASLGAIERQPDWFAPYDRYDAPTAARAPAPMLMDAWFDAAGRLWVLGKAADAKWASGLGAPHDDGGRTVTAVVDPDKVYDTVLEVINPKTGALIAETRFDVSYPFAVEPGVVMRVLTTRDGWNRAELMRVRFDSTRVTLTP